MECRPISSRLTTIRLREIPFNITVEQVYAPSSDYDNSEIENFYDQLQNVIDQTPKMDIVVVQGDWNTRAGKDAYENWQGICDASAMKTQMKEDSDFWSLPPLTILCWQQSQHKASRRWFW